MNASAKYSGWQLDVYDSNQAVGSRENLDDVTGAPLTATETLLEGHHHIADGKVPLHSRPFLPGGKGTKVNRLL